MQDGSYDDKAIEKQGRQVEQLKNQKVKADDKAEQRSNKGSGFGDLREIWGKPNSGSINGKDSSKFQIGNALLGKPNSGSINGKTDLRGVTNSMFDTSKSDKYDRDNYKSTPRDNAAFGAIATSLGRQAQSKQPGAAAQQAPKAPPPANKAPVAPLIPIEPKAKPTPKPKAKEPDDE